jgi:hypothetical protein
MKRILPGLAALLALAGCQEKLSLEEAQARCTQQGGLLVVIYTQKITASGPGEQVASPGDCVPTGKFDVPPQPPPPANGPGDTRTLK